MSLKRIMMIFSILRDEGRDHNISIDDILAQDKSGYLKRIPQDKLRPMISIAATKSGWGLSPRTHKYSKY